MLCTGPPAHGATALAQYANANKNTSRIICVRTVRLRQLIRAMLEQGGVQLGRGAYGVVVRSHSSADRAVKMLKQEHAYDRVARSGLRKEFQILKQMDHRHIVKVYAFDSWHCKFDMALLRGQDAGKLIDAQACCVLNSRQLLGLQDAIMHMHHKRWVHLDIKPENLVSTGEQYILIDFGLAEQRGTLVGCPYVVTEGYRTPEHALCDEDSLIRACTSMDVYALGITALEMVLGTRIYTRLTACRSSKMGRSLVLSQLFYKAGGPLLPAIRAMLREDRNKRYLAYVTHDQAHTSAAGAQ
jgi:serine/threonine protein kinase